MEAAVENSENKTSADIPAESGESSLEAGIAESKEAIATAAPIKKRGKKPYPRDENGNIIRPAKAENPAPKSASESAAVVSTPPPVYLEAALNFPFKGLALKTGYPGWELSEKEQKDNAILLDAVLRRYLPQLQSEHPELFALSIGLGMACAARYMGYRAYLESRAAQDAISRSEGRESVAETIPPTAPGKKKNQKTPIVNPEAAPGEGLGNFLNGTQSRSPEI